MTTLLTPGPVEVTKEVLESEKFLVGHRSSTFREIVKECRERIMNLAKADFATMTTGSGTLAVESMIYSYINRNENVLCLSYGEFGDRLGISVQRRGANAIMLRKKPEDPVTFEEIEEFLEKHPASAIAFIHNETGNGTSVQNLMDLTRKCKNAGLKVLVDSVSGFACLPVHLSGSGIDMLATCGHKGIASTPGIGIVAMNSESLSDLKDADVPTYLDLKKSIHFMDKDETPYTPSVGTFNALRTALRMLADEGIDKRVERTTYLAKYVRNELQGNGYSVVGSPETYSNSVINFHVSQNSRKMVKELNTLGFTVSAGMGPLSESTLRIGIMGITEKGTLDRFLESLYSVDVRN